MNGKPDLEQYRAEIREQVCSKCIERPEGSPPCAPHGKKCGIELNLELLVNAVHRVHSGAMDGYIEQFHNEVCAHCPELGGEDCPCPLKYLLLLAVQAIEEVDERHSRLLRSIDS